MLTFARQPIVLWTSIFVILLSFFSRIANSGPSWKFQPEMQFEVRQESNGTLPDCTLSYTTDAWTTCRDVLRQFWITYDYFKWANPQVGENCTNFEPGETYCIKRPTNDNAVSVSQDGLCGASQNFTVTCVGSEGGDCCGSGGYCGTGDEYCAPGNCQEGACEGGIPYSTDGTCGEQNRYLECPPKFGACCSADGFCGDSEEYCGEGCQSGDCLSSTPTSSSTAPTPTLPPGSVSEDGTCGYKRKYVCEGSTFGDCCSAAGYCGSDIYACSKDYNCQPEFGLCDETAPTSSAS